MKENSLLALSGVYHIKERLFSRLLRRHGMENISPAQSRILMAVWEQDDIPVRQLAALTSLDKSTLSLSARPTAPSVPKPCTTWRRSSTAA